MNLPLSILGPTTLFDQRRSPSLEFIARRVGPVISGESCQQLRRVIANYMDLTKHRRCSAKVLVGSLDIIVLQRQPGIRQQQMLLRLGLDQVDPTSASQRFGRRLQFMSNEAQLRAKHVRFHLAGAVLCSLANVRDLIDVVRR